mmetsp:Transcript_24461/g.40007  ORF Transcript_24461/g.40007 Transcript_24461/m.40007 type:complete len:537 (+) Transcript_24461:179-1789(+)
METPRKRQLTHRASSTRTNAYRLHFSCEHIGKYRSYTKRIIKWQFGFTNLQAAREGKRGVECRGEEHEVVLIWSVKSGKTRLFWNKINISHLFQDNRNTEAVTISWQSRSGETFQISAHESPTRFAPQYDFLLDGVSVFSLPHLSELDPMIGTEHSGDPEVRTEATPDTRSEGACSMDYDTFQETPDVGFRLSMAGFAPSSHPADDLMDDLTSTCFTNLLESLRRTITSVIPDSEDMVSRAIVKALSEDRCESSSCSSSLGSSCTLDSLPLSAIQIEAEAIWETTEWINLNVQYAPRPDVEEQKREFLQKQMDTTFIHAHHDRLSEDEATRILSDVATLLGIPIRSPVPRDTMILKDIGVNTDPESLLASLMVYGEILEVGVAPGHRLAICRFATERGPLRALSAAEQGLLIIDETRPQVSLIEKPLVSERPEMLGRRALSTPAVSAHPLEKPSLARRRSHHRNTVQIDTLISETPFLRLVNDPAVLWSVDSSSYVKPNVMNKDPVIDPVQELSFYPNEETPVSPGSGPLAFSDDL